MPKAKATGTIFGHSVGDLQTGLTVGDGAITGSLAYVSEGSLPTAWGAGNFMALDFGDVDTTGLVSLKVGMEPSQGSGLVELLGEPDRIRANTADNLRFRTFLYTQVRYMRTR